MLFRFLQNCLEQRKSLKFSAKGYAAVIFIVCIPLILFGTKLILDQRTSNNVDIRGVKSADKIENIHKKCAKDAALAVAQNWNPGLTFGQQREGVYKVADMVYNVSPAANKASSMNEAITGLDIPSKIIVDTKSTYFPLLVTYQNYINLSASAKLVGYEAVRKYIHNWNASRAGGNDGYLMWLGIDKGSDAVNRQSKFDELDEDQIEIGNFVLKQHEIYVDSHLYNCLQTTHSDGNYGSTRAEFGSISDENNSLGIYSFVTNLRPYGVITSNKYGSKQTESTNYDTIYYSRRSTGDDANNVYIEIADDQVDGGKIAVQTDWSEDNDNSTTAYAIPAQCNVDIVLAVPVNGATSNVNNLDAASDPAGNINTYSSSSALTNSIKNTPIYQMGQACKNFVKDNFYHTRGVYMSLIPYSGKLSISPDRAAIWTVPFSPFVDTSVDTQKMIGACLYATKGEKDSALTRSNLTTTIKTGVSTTSPYVWGDLSQGCPIMFRRGVANNGYGNNTYYSGILFDTSNPQTSGDNYKYLRMNLNPCYVGYANHSSMRCEANCTYYAANPYYIIEPTSDLVKIYEMCNALKPFYDENNVSNFLFLPFEWSHNFFKNWTRDQEVQAVVGDGDDAVLKRDSKTAAGRKKAVILLVNKPDWFEPGELTYLGFDNDASEVPTVESDKIDFSINYSDTTKKFLDGSKYNGTFAGPKKILRLTKKSGNNLVRDEGYYTTESGIYRLKFPHKGRLKLIVAPKYNSSSSSSVTFYQDNINSESDVRNQTTGSKVALGVPQGITKAQEFVFSGAYFPPAGTNWYPSCSYGKNFRSNLSVKKVRYAVNGARIDSCVLRDQVIRYYSGVYYNRRWTTYNSVYNGVTTTSPLILNDGSLDPESNYERSSRNNTAVGSGDYDRSGWYTPRSYIAGYSGSAYDFTAYVNNPYPLRRDSCFHFTSSPIGYHINAWPYIFQFSARVDGIKRGYLIVSGYDGLSSFYYIHPNGSQTAFRVPSWWAPFDLSSYNTDNTDYIQFKNTNSYHSSLKQIYIKNKDEKTLQSTTPITSNPIYYNPLMNNQGIYLANYNGQNWICFQGDGELHVNVVPTNVSSIQFMNVSKYTSSRKITETTEFLFSPSDVYNSKDGDDYYIEFDARVLKLISAELMNFQYSSLEQENNTYDDSDVITKGQSGNYLSWGLRSVPISERSIACYNNSWTNGNFKLTNVSNTTYNSGYGGISPNALNTETKLKISSDTLADVNLTINPINPGYVTFYSDNIGSSYDVVNSTKGTSVALNQKMIINGTETFVFSGPSLPSNYTSQDVVNSSLGKNFSHNLCVKKVKYDLDRATITSCKLKRQVVRDYLGQYGRMNSSIKPLILSDGTTASRSGFTDWDGKSAYHPTTKSQYPLYRDSCIRVCSNTNTSYSTSDNLSSSCYFFGLSNASYYMNTVIYVKAFGVAAPCVMYRGSHESVQFTYHNSSSSWPSYIAGGVLGWNSGTMTSSAHGSTFAHFKFQGTSNKDLWIYMIKNGDDERKTLQSTSAITSDPVSYSNLKENKGIYLANHNGNWICFQGDGELTVTVRASGSDGGSYIKVNELSGSGAMVTRTKTVSNAGQVITIPASALVQEGNEYATTIILRNVCITNAKQEKGIQSIPCLLSTTSGTATLAQDNVSGIRNVKICSLISYDSDLRKYYYDLDNGSVGQFAAKWANRTEFVYDIMTFNLQTYGYRSVLEEALNGKYTNGLYTVSSSTNSQIATTYRGDIELTVAPSFSETSNKGTIKQNFGSNTSTQQIASKQTIRILGSDLVYDGRRYYMGFTINNLTILKVKLLSAEAKIVYPLDLKYTQKINWQDSNVSIDSDISITGNYATDSLSSRFINTNKFNPKVGHKNKATGISTIINILSPILGKFTQPEQSDNQGETFLTGLIRMYSPMKRSSPNKYTQVEPYSSSYNDKAAMMANTLTNPYNNALLKNNLQTVSIDATTAVGNATSRACQRLKDEYGDNLHIYVVKYRPQQQYKTFPGYNVNQITKDHNYNVIDSCATSPQYVFNIRDDQLAEKNLTNVLNNIAIDIKEWANYEPAKNVKVNSLADAVEKASGEAQQLEDMVNNN